MPYQFDYSKSDSVSVLDAVGRHVATWRRDAGDPLFRLYRVNGSAVIREDGKPVCASHHSRIPARTEQVSYLI